MRAMPAREKRSRAWRIPRRNGNCSGIDGMPPSHPPEITMNIPALRTQAAALLLPMCLLSGCGQDASPSTALPPVVIPVIGTEKAACDLLTAADMKALYGLEFAAPRGMQTGVRGRGTGRVGTCSWRAGNVIVTLVVRQAQDAKDAAAVWKHGRLERLVAGGKTHPLPGLGDEAYYDSLMQQVHVLAGDTWLMVVASSSQQADEAAMGARVAAIVLARM